MSGSLLAGASVAAFARHETFHPRYGWLRKGYVEASRDPGVFLSPEATVHLGVGKNMVNAIRYWSYAYKILQEVPNSDRPRLPRAGPTEFGRSIFDEAGWDPYLEDVGTLWLLHWKLFVPTCTAPVWWAIFNLVPVATFTETQLLAHVLELVDATGWPSVVEASVKKDVDCVLRMYASRGQGRQTLDDILDCPFRELRLIEPVPGESRSWRFALADTTRPPALVVAYAALDFLARADKSAASVSVARLAMDAGSPGLIFRMSELGLASSLREASAKVRGMHLIDSGGRPQLILDADPETVARLALDQYFQRTEMRQTA